MDDTEKARLRLDAVLVESPDPAALADFYRRGLGLGDPRPVGDDHLGFPLANTYLGFERAPAAGPTGRRAASLWFTVTDIHAAHRRLLDAGAREREPPFRCADDETLATVLDPEGNVIGLIQPDPPAPPE